MVDTRAPGDYPAKLYAGGVPTTRGVLYRSDTNVRAVIRHVGLVNTTNAQQTAKVWLSGVLVEAGAVLAAGDGVGQDVSMWVLPPGEAIEAEGSVVGLNAFVYGVQEVMA